MRIVTTIILLILTVFSWAQENTTPDFKWGNCSYFNLAENQSVFFEGVELKLLTSDQLFSTIKIGDDTTRVKVARRSMPVAFGGIQLFVADNQFLKSLVENKSVHGLLKADVLVGVKKMGSPWLNRKNFVFPVSFYDGFAWTQTEDRYMFSSIQRGNNIESYEGIAVDLHDARGEEKHWLVALENSSVVWVEEQKVGNIKTACVLLKSNQFDDVYYVYDRLYKKNLEVKAGQDIVKGQLVATAWGDDVWGHAQIAVVYSDSIPDYENRYENCVNFFPQLYGLYFQHSYPYQKTFKKGKIVFGELGKSNSDTYEEYTGQGWAETHWNKTEKTEVLVGSNVRLRKKLFAGTRAASVNPENYFEYEVSVGNGGYRVRARLGDGEKESWQRIVFEGVDAGMFVLNAGEFKWTSERIVRVKDRKLTVRIYVDKTNAKVAGIRELVFQRAY